MGLYCQKSGKVEVVHYIGPVELVSTSYYSVAEAWIILGLQKGKRQQIFKSQVPK